MRNYYAIEKVDRMSYDKQYETLNYLLDKDVKFPLCTEELKLLQELMYRDSVRTHKRARRQIRKQLNK